MALTRWHGTLLSQGSAPPPCHYCKILLLHRAALTAVWLGLPDMCGHHWQVWCAYMAAGPMPGHSCSVRPLCWKRTPTSRMASVPSTWANTQPFMWVWALRRGHTPISRTGFVRHGGPPGGVPCRYGPTRGTRTPVPKICVCISWWAAPQPSNHLSISLFDYMFLLDNSGAHTATYHPMLS